MASRFDPSAFIEAEDRATLAALATPASVLPLPAIAHKAPEICHFQPASKPALAAIATIAAVPLSDTPWASIVARFIAQRCPDHIPADHWDELINEAETIERKWGSIAHDLGWDALTLYGCPSEPLAPRFGQSGLVHAIVTLKTPVRLTALRADRATLQPWRGAALSFYPTLRPGAVLLWEAYGMTSGP